MPSLFRFGEMWSVAEDWLFSFEVVFDIESN